METSVRVKRGALVGRTRRVMAVLGYGSGGETIHTACIGRGGVLGGALLRIHLGKLCNETRGASSCFGRTGRGHGGIDGEKGQPEQQHQMSAAIAATSVTARGTAS
ncbi:hypothetical protein B1810_19835 [Panacagrimonas perspica]|nr:hypothetical protein B1810_19835 [Panacagrimonas perspica]